MMSCPISGVRVDVKMYHISELDLSFFYLSGRLSGTLNQGFGTEVGTHEKGRA